MVKGLTMNETTEIYQEIMLNEMRRAITMSWIKYRGSLYEKQRRKNKLFFQKIIQYKIYTCTNRDGMQ